MTQRQEMQYDFPAISIRRELFLRIGSYNDRNDGFCRTFFSRSKHNFSRIRKIGKPSRIKPPWKRTTL